MVIEYINFHKHLDRLKAIIFVDFTADVQVIDMLVDFLETKTIEVLKVSVHRVAGSGTLYLLTRILSKKSTIVSLHYEEKNISCASVLFEKSAALELPSGLQYLTLKMSHPHAWHVFEGFLDKRINETCEIKSITLCGSEEYGVFRKLLAVLARIKTLTKFALSKIGDFHYSLDALGELKRLKCLCIRDMQIEETVDSFVHTIRKLPHLEDIALSDVHWHPSNMDRLIDFLEEKYRLSFWSLCGTPRLSDEQEKRFVNIHRYHDDNSQFNIYPMKNADLLKIYMCETVKQSQWYKQTKVFMGTHIVPKLYSNSLLTMLPNELLRKLCVLMNCS